jgi:hypothetical protein
MFVAATCVDCGDKYIKDKGRDGMCPRCVPSDEPLPWDSLDPFEAQDDIDMRWE